VDGGGHFYKRQVVEVCGGHGLLVECEFSMRSLGRRHAELVENNY
jgi:hypothetical protein